MGAGAVSNKVDDGDLGAVNSETAIVPYSHTLINENVPATVPDLAGRSSSDTKISAADFCKRFSCLAQETRKQCRSRKHRDFFPERRSSAADHEALAGLQVAYEGLSNKEKDAKCSDDDDGDDDVRDKDFKTRLTVVLTKAATVASDQTATASSTNPVTFGDSVRQQVEDQFKIVKELVGALTKNGSKKYFKKQWLDMQRDVNSKIKDVFPDKKDSKLAVEYILNGFEVFLFDMDVERLAALLRKSGDEQQAAYILQLKQQLQKYADSDPSVSRLRNNPLYAETVNMTRDLWAACNQNELYTYTTSATRSTRSTRSTGMPAVIAHLEYIVTLGEEPVAQTNAPPSVADQRMMHQIFSHMHANRQASRQASRQSRHEQGRRSRQSFHQGRYQQRQSPSRQGRSKYRQGVYSQRRSKSPQRRSNKYAQGRYQALRTMDGLLRQLSPRSISYSAASEAKPESRTRTRTRTRQDGPQRSRRALSRGARRSSSRAKSSAERSRTGKSVAYRSRR